MSAQQAFAEALFAAGTVCPPGLRAWNDSDPARRFAVYRNNVMVSLIDALADSYPVTQALVGEEFFRAMARQFVTAHPPRTPVLALYGEELADFIAGFAPVASLAYLADVARLEMLRVLAFHAADAEVLTAQEIAGLLDDPAALVHAEFHLHPSLGVVRSRHAVASLWAAHQAADVTAALAQVAVDQAEVALVWRDGLEVDIARIGDGVATFILILKQGVAFGTAAEQALAADPGFDLVATLGLLIRIGAITGIDISRSATA